MHWSPALIIMIILLSSFTLSKINWTKEISTIQASIYQPNLTLKEKWSSEGVRKTMSMINGSISSAQKGEFIIFPETAIIFDKDDLNSWFSDIEEETQLRNISLISGIIAKDPKNPSLIERYNRIEGFGAIKGNYDKIHLVPFGEYIPLRDYLDKFLDILGINLINTLPGESYSLIKTDNIAVSASICYEIAFNDLVRRTAKKGNLLVTISNDTWFGASIGPEQHLEIAQSRALEHQKSLIRATNSGISAIIDKKGNIVSRQGFFEDKQIKEKVFIYEGKTPFSVVGNWFIYGYIMLIYMYLLLYKRTNVL
jgi:apolipoprotein N-acyltransferase